MTANIGRPPFKANDAFNLPAAIIGAAERPIMFSRFVHGGVRIGEAVAVEVESPDRQTTRQIRASKNLFIPKTFIKDHREMMSEYYSTSL